MAENKPTNRERLREITDGIEQGIKFQLEVSVLSIILQNHSGIVGLSSFLRI